jgi:integrase/recombinase XerD
MREKLRFLDLFRRFISYYESTPFDEEKKSKKTISGYIAKYHRVQEYLILEKLTGISYDEFNVSLAKKLFLWSKSKHSHNYAVRILELCRSVLTHSYNQEIIRTNNLFMFKLKKEKPKKPVYLTPEEIALIKATQFHPPFYQRVADLFLFQCYTGFDYADLCTVNASNLYLHPIDKRQYIIKKRIKTGHEAYIPYFENISAIWSKYNYQLPIMTNQVYNRSLKELALICGIEKRITSHVGRKTYGMIKLNYEGYGIESVSKMLGHSAIKTTETFYAQVNLNLISKELTKLGI